MSISGFGAQRAGSVIRLLLAIAVVFGLVASCQKLDVTAVEVMEVEVSPNSATVLIGQTRQFTVTLSDAAGNTLQRSVNWSTANVNVATVDGDGQVRGLGPGTTTVTASSGGRSGQATVNVTATLVTSVEVIPNTAGLRPGEFVDLQAVARDGNGATVPGKIPSWLSQNPSIASVTQAGRVTAGAVGTTRVTATIDGKVGEAAITVTSDPVVSVQLLPPTASVAEGESLLLQTVLRNGAGTILTGRQVTYTTSDANIAMVDNQGRVTGVRAGTATITASSEGRTGQSVITVTPRPVAAIEVTPPSASLVVGGTVTLEAVAKAQDGTVLLGRTFAWSSSAPSVASVNNGLVRGLAIGESTITASADGKSGSARVIVSNQPVASVEIQPASGNVIEGDSLNLTAITRDLAGTVLTNRVITWSSSNNAIATVAPSTGGAVKLKAVAPGNVTITATSEGRSGTANFVVQQLPVTAVEVLPLTATVFSGGSQGYQATVRSGSIVLTNRPVQWNTSDASTATITPTSPGALTATANAAATPPCPAPAQSCNVTLSATAGGITGNATLTVLKRIATIQLAPPALTLTVGGAGAQVTADVRASDNTQLTSRVLAWTSTSPNVALAVAPGGQAASLTAVGANCVGQSCVIPVIASAEGVADTVIVTVPKPAASVTITPPSMTLFAGVSTKAQAVVRASDQTVLTGRVVTWNTTNSSIVTVAGIGTFGDSANVTAGTCPPNIGTCQASIAASAEGVTGNATVIVRKPVVTVTVNPPALTVDTGKTATVRAVLTAGDGSPITDRLVGWSTSAPSVATVTGVGTFQLDATVRGAGLGQAIVTAVAEGVSGSTTVTAVEPVASVEIQPTNPTLAEGDSTIVQAIVKGTSGNVLTNRVVTWQSTNSNLATLTGITAPYFPDAKLKAIKCPVGQATCTVTIQAIASGVLGQTSLTVNKVLHHVTITPNPAPPLLAGSGGSSGTLQLTARPEADDGTLLNVPIVSWTTNNSFIATVDGTGLVTAQGADGLCTTEACAVNISASTANGTTGTITVSVRKPVQTIEVTPAAANMSVSGSPYPATQVFTAVLKSLDGTVLTYLVPTWTATGTGGPPPGQVTLNTLSGSTTTATATRQGQVNLTASAQGKTSLIVVITITP